MTNDIGNSQRDRSQNLRQDHHGHGGLERQRPRRAEAAAVCSQAVGRGQRPDSGLGIVVVIWLDKMTFFLLNIR